MMKRRVNKICAVALAGCLLLGLAAPAAWAAPEKDVISIDSVEDLVKLAGNCSLDTWSRGKTVVLEADLDLSGRNFTPIPTFGGTFRGQGHTISGLRVADSGSAMGFFRYVQKGALIQDLRLTGVLAPGGTSAKVGGVAGVNAGTLQNVSFRGSVRGESTVGGIVGWNETSGEVAGCTMMGTVLGSDATGGIAGKNDGLLIKCTNEAEVNTTSPDHSVSLEDFAANPPIESLATESEEPDSDPLMESHSDTGGVVGYTSGAVQSCTNRGDVGYPHVGYNIGGVAGRQSGYLAGCVNSGTIYGRKDVGGVVGQVEPYMALTPGSDTLERLRAELDTLQNLIDRALDDAEARNDDISARLTSIGNCTDAARDSSKILLDQAADVVDENVETLNSLSASVTAALDQASPGLDDLAAASERLQDLTDQLGDALDTLAQAAGSSQDVMEDAHRAVESLRQGCEELGNAAHAMGSAVDHLLQAVVVKDEEAARAALKELAEAQTNFAAGLHQTGQALTALIDVINGTMPDQEALNQALGNLSQSLKTMSDSMQKSGQAMTKLAGAVTLDWGHILEALRELSRGQKSLQAAAAHFTDSLVHVKTLLREARALFGDLQDGLEQLEDVSATASAVGRRLEQAFATFHDAVETLIEDGPVELTPIGEETRAAGDDLYASLNDLSREMKGLHSAVDETGDVLAEDLRAISRQFNTVFDVLLDALEHLRDGPSSDKSDYIQDTSDEDIAATRLGKVTASVNSGMVDGDRNVGGIVGTMSIEFDLDPEDDNSLLSFSRTYETKAVLENSINRGSVTAKKDCAGGLAGRMDLGTVVKGQNYGNVTSTSGSYVGGIAGWADATVRASYAKCVLSGTDYIGGIAGWASCLYGCYAIATVEEGKECVGAVAGAVDEKSREIRDNHFVKTGVAGIDGISYAGLAEPIAFQELREVTDVPAELVSFLLTLTADGETVSQVPFRYGEDLSLVELPEVPPKEGYYGSWPEFDTSGLRSDITLEAVYTPWVTLTASPETEGKLALALAEGQFTQDAVLHVKDSALPPPPEAAQSQQLDIWELTLSGTELTESDSVPIRLLNRGGGSASVWQCVDGQWRPVETRVNGHYLQLTMTGTEGVFCIRSGQGHLALLLIPLAAVGGLALVLLLRKRSHRKKPRASPKAPKPPKEKN